MPEPMADLSASKSSQAEDSVISAPVQHTGRQGFLPFPTNLWDRFFVSMVILVALHLLWLRFIEPLFLPTYTLWGATLISLILMYIIMRWG